MKTIATICMLLDHIGFVFFPGQWGWRMIGRLAMPIFAYCIGRGMVYTSSKKRYIKRLGAFAIVSQVPFWLMRWAASGGKLITLHLNIGFTFFIATCIIYGTTYCLEKKSVLTKKMIFLVLLAIVLSESLHMDYGAYGMMLVIGCYWVIREKKNQGLLLALYTFLTLLAYGNEPELFALQEMGVLGLGICFLLVNFSERGLGKFFYIFYPLHMIILWGIKMIG